jgi:Zn-dependent membrane protease YugP
MILFWDDPARTSLLLLFALVPALLPMVTGLALVFWARRRIARAGATAVEAPVDGATAAAAILEAAGVSGTSIVPATGPLANFYDPARKELRLSRAFLEGRTPRALAIASHEAGHAIQDAQGYWPSRLRVPLVLGAKLGTGVALMSCLAGLLMLYLDLIFRSGLLFSAIAIFLLALQVIERDANRRSRNAGALAGLGEPFESALDATTWDDLAAMLPSWKRGSAESKVQRSAV